MPSPFPGMDPYLEDPAFWPDFHSRFINYWCEAIADRLPDHYEATLSERVTLAEADDHSRKQFGPDVALWQSAPDSGQPVQPVAGVATLEPVTIPLLRLDEVRETFIEIRTRPGREIVAVLELLSPSNKRGPGHEDYLRKRHAVIMADAHLVELDLLLGGQRIALERPLPVGDYFALIAHADRRFDCDVYAWSLRHPLPRLPIPLRAPDPDLVIDLAAVFATAYDRGRFGRRLRYEGPPVGPLRDADREWVAERAAAP